MAISILVPEKWRRYVNGFLLACLNWFWTLASDLVPPRRAVSFDQTGSFQIVYVLETFTASFYCNCCLLPTGF